MGVKASQELVVIAENLKRLMDAHVSLNSQSAVGRAAKVDQKTVARLLSKEHEPRVDVVAKIAGAFGITALQLMTPNLPSSMPKAMRDLNGVEGQLVATFRELPGPAQEELLNMAERLKEAPSEPIKAPVRQKSEPSFS